MTFVYRYKVTWGDTDAAGIVYYPNFYSWMNHATCELFEQIDCSTSALFYREKIGLPVLKTECEHYAPAYFHDEIEIQSTVEEVRNKVIKIRHRIYRDDTLLAEGCEVRAWTSFRDERPQAVPIPDFVKQKLSSESGTEK